VDFPEVLHIITKKDSVTCFMGVNKVFG